MIKTEYDSHEARTELTRISGEPKEAEIYRQRENALSDKSNALLSTAKIEGVSIKLIMKITGLSREEIESI